MWETGLTTVYDSVVVDIRHGHQRVTDRVLVVQPAGAVVSVKVEAFTLATVSAGLPTVLQGRDVALQVPTRDVSVLC